MPLREKYLLSDYVRPGFPLHVGQTPAPEVPMHAHDFYEVAFVARGGLRHEFEHQEAAPMDAGDFVLLNPFERHGYAQRKGSLNLVNLIFATHYPTTLGQGLGQEELLSPFHLPRRIGRPEETQRRELAGLFQAALGEYESQKEGWRLSVTGLVLQILTRCRRILGADPANRQPASASRLTPVLALIDARFTTDLTLGAIARLAGLSATYMSELFRSATGRTFKQYLIERRLRYAVHLLEHGNAPVREICQESGFGDLTHFERQVRRYSGMAPLELRRRSAARHPTAS
jgi:AraC-like DNA-binding protein